MKIINTCTKLFFSLSVYASVLALPLLIVSETAHGTTSCPAWDVNQIYTENACVSYKDTLYKAQWWTKGDVPHIGANAWDSPWTLADNNLPAPSPPLPPVDNNSPIDPPRTDEISGPVKGWPEKRIAMGSIVQGGATEFETLKQRPVDAIFTYAGNDGAGDRGVFMENDTKVINVLNQTRMLQGATGQLVRPVIVFYTVDGSSSIWAIQQDLNIDPEANPDNLKLHYANLIRVSQLLETNKDLYPALVLNPDFLGEVHKQCAPGYCPIPYAGNPYVTNPADQVKIKVKSSLENAITFLNAQGYTNFKIEDIPSTFKNDEASLADYIASINWIIRTFGPNVTFGWQDNVWAGDPTAHAWIHTAANTKADGSIDTSIVNQHVQDEVAFLEKLAVYSNPYKPDFIVFDKWERDVFDSGLEGAGVNNAYLYSVKDWDVYMAFVSGVSEQLGDMPVMLWQIPGGHLQINGDLDTRNDHASTAATYFLGDDKLDPQLGNLKTYISNFVFARPYMYSVNDPSVVNYLRCPPANANCWSKNRLSDIKGKNIFSILWGGGSTTGVAGLSEKLDDKGWLYSKLQGSQ